MAKSKKIFGVSQTVVDAMTGEVLESKVTSTYINRHSESFGMYTTTNGLEWAKPIRGYLLFLMVMNEYSDKNGVISLTPSLRKNIRHFFDFKNDTTMTNVFKLMIKHNVMKRIAHNSYMINPETVYKGSTNDKTDRINNYTKAICD